MKALQAKYVDIHQRLIDRCKKNDHKAQLELYKLYYKAMYNTCLRIVRNNALAADIMQEAFLSVFEKIASYKGNSTFGAWLKRIVINKSLDELKKQKPLFDSIETSTEAYTMQDEPYSGEYENDLNNRISLIKEALNRMPDGYRVILSLHLFEGYDYEEIAQILNIGESTVRSQFTRAKQKLIDILNVKYELE